MRRPKVVRKKHSKGKLAGLGGLALLTLVALVWWGKGGESTGGAVTAPAAVIDAGGRGPLLPPAASNSAADGTFAQGRKLAILPPTPMASDPLLAAFQATSGRVEYRWEKDGQPIAGEESNRLAAEHFVKGEVITAIVDHDGTRYDSSVTIGNQPPTVRTVSFTNAAIHRGVDIELEVAGEDPDGDSVTFAYEWYINGQRLDFADGAVLAGDRFSRGDQVQFRVIPFDGEDRGEPYHGVPITIPNAPPVFVTSPPLNFQSESYRYAARAEDADDDPVAYALEDPPPGMVIDRKSGVIDWELTGVPDGEYRIVIAADDGQGQKGYQEYTLIMARQ